MLPFNPAAGWPILPAMDAITKPPFLLTDRAAARIMELAGNTGQSLRISVLAGGCSGFQYQFELDGNVTDDDLVVANGAAQVLIDPASLDLLAGGELDYVEELMSAHFIVRNPNASSGCGCGSSFAL
jgi:iron-sulfur cluster assembly accessory protein